MKKIYFIIGLISCSLSACTLYKKPEVPPILAPSHFKNEIKESYAPLNNYWWENFNDSQLNDLVHIALKNNPSYQIALKNIDIAKTYVTQNQSNLFPQVNLNFNLSRNKSMSLFNTNNFVTSANPSIANNSGNSTSQFGRIFNLIQLFGSVSYELDVWNQIGNTVNQAKATVASTTADTEVVKLTLLSNVVNTYFQINALTENLKILKQQYKMTQALFHLTKTQYHGKLIDITTVSDTNNALDNLTIAIKANEKQREIAINALAYFIGVTPEEFLVPYQTSKILTSHKNLVPPGIPASMMANRPDIQSAYFQILSYGYIEKQAIANFLPTFNLTGTDGYANTSFSRFFTPTNAFWNYGLNLLQPIFDYKLRMSEYKRSKYQYESAILNYKNVIKNAYQEVNNALVSYKKDNEALQAYQREILHSQQKSDVALAQYQAGYADYATYINDQLALLQNSYNLTNQQLLVKQDVIQIYKTLGLGLG